MLKVEFSTDNAAFEGDLLTEECTWILGRISNDLLEGRTEGKCRDANGNVVGSWSLTERLA